MNIIKIEEIHIKSKKRNLNKSWTIIENLDIIKSKDIKNSGKTIEDYSIVLIKDLQKVCNCRGFAVKELDQICIQFQGDHKETIKNYLMKTFDFKEENIKLHG